MYFGTEHRNRGAYVVSKIRAPNMFNVHILQTIKAILIRSADTQFFKHFSYSVKVSEIL